MQTSSTSFSSSSMSQPPAAKIYACRWAWCGSSFHDSTQLNRHVVYEHARRAIPVRRQDILMLRRAEEGLGESLDFMPGLTSSSTSQNSTPTDLTKLAVGDPSSSLPSPPASSPASHLRDEQIFDRIHSHSPLSEGFSPQQEVPMSTFGSLSSPADSPPLLVIPDSPSFSSLVARSNKHKSHSYQSEGPPVEQPRRANPLSQSSSDSSTVSHLSVEQQLTQTLESDDEENGNLDANGEDDVPEPTGHEGLSQMSLSQDQPTSGAELNRHSSEPSQTGTDSQSQSLAQGPLFANPESFSQIPSQFQSLPFHHHGAKSSSTKVPSVFPEPLSNASLALSQPAPLASPTFAVSTPPQRQSWLQPQRRKRSSQASDQILLHEEIMNPSPPKRDLTTSQPSRRVSRTPKSKKVFRSGTLQITPAAKTIPEESDSQHSDTLLQEVQPVQENKYDPWANSQTQDYMDSSQSQDLSYPPLQTQAPYNSQIVSQF